MRAQKRDANEREIIDALEAVGCTVDPLEGGNGRPDLLIGEPRTRQNILMEVKDGRLTPSARRLNPKQKGYHSWFAGRIHLAETVEQALSIVHHYRSRRDQVDTKQS